MTSAGDQIRGRLADLTSAHVADACLRAGFDVRTAPSELAPLLPTMTVRGPVCPVRHYGSVDIFLEAIDGAEPGRVLVIDNKGRIDEACVGDLIAIEARAAGLEGLVVWGLHRDTPELIEIGLPVFSLGATPVGPRRLDPRDGHAFGPVRIGEALVDESDWVLGDADGVIFVRGDDLVALTDIAESIRDAEQRQARRVREGHSLRDQFAFEEFRKKRAEDPGYTLRQHLIEIGGAIET